MESVVAAGYGNVAKFAVPRRVLIVPGLNGHPGLLMRWAPALFPDWEHRCFNHHLDLADGGVPGLAERALAELNGGEAYVCGESFGGTIALTMAHQYPQQVKGLVLLSAFGWYPSMLARRAQAALAVWSFLGGRVPTPMYRTGRLAAVPTQLGLRWPRSLFAQYIDRPRAHVAAYRAKAELALTFDARPWLHEISCPTLVLTGSWDPVVPASAGRELATSIPNARLNQLTGGHLVHLVRAQRVGELITDWARDLH
jgi:aminoacrylate hydrolase